MKSWYVNMKKGIKVKTIFIILVIGIIICSLIIIFSKIKSKKSDVIDSGSIGTETIESSSNVKINLDDYKEEIEKIKYITNQGILYEDNEIKITTFNEKYDGEYNEKYDYPFDIDGDINEIYIYNKTNSDLEYKITRATMNNYNILGTSDDGDIELGGYDYFQFDNIDILSELIEAMGVGFFNNIELELELEGDDIGEITKQISIKTNCKEKVKEFNLPKSKIYDKDGIKLFLLEKYISDNTSLAMKVKDKMEKDGYDSFYENKEIQNDPVLWLIAVNNTNQDKAIKVKTECSSIDTSKNYYINDKGTNENINANMIDTILINGLEETWVEKEQAFNPKDVKFTIIIDDKECYTIDFADAEIK